MGSLINQITSVRSFIASALFAAAFCLMPFTAVAESPSAGSSLVNQVTAVYTDANHNTEYTDAVTGEKYPLSASASVATLVGGAPVLQIEKLASSDPVGVGGTLTYTIRYSNTGNAPATAVSIVDRLSKHLEFVSATGGGVYAPGATDGGTVTWDLGGLAGGETGTLTLVTQVKTPADYSPGDPDTIGSGTLIYNTAEVGSAETENSRTIVTTVGNAPNLQIEKSASSAFIYPGGNITYTLSYSNIGNSDATNVYIVDTLPLSVVYEEGSITGGGSISGRTITWLIGVLEPGTEGEVSFTVSLSPIANEEQIVSNVAVILSNELSPATSEFITTDVVSPSLGLFKEDSPDPVFVGNPLTYSITVQNNGTAPLTGVIVRDSVPEGTAFVSADEGGVLSAGTVEWSLADLTPGESRTVRAVFSVSSGLAEGTIIQNTAVVISNEIPYPTPTTATTVSERTPGIIRFYDSEWQPASSYRIGDTICMQVTDLDRNTDPDAVEQVDITLTHAESGDSETVTLTETGENTGIFRGCIPSTSALAEEDDGYITVSEDTTITATYTDPLDESPISDDTALIDPFGIVFDSVTGLPVTAAVVSLYWDSTGSGTWVLAANHPSWPSGQDDVVTTGAAGSFAFPLVPPGEYYFDVVPGTTYTFPSTVPDSDLPAGFAITTASRGATFTLAAGDPPLNIDVPVDPSPDTEWLTVSKEANKTTASIGDIILYTVTIGNPGSVSINLVSVVDTMPSGILYLSGSTEIDGVSAGDPDIEGNTLTWSIASIPAGESVEISYRAVTGPGTSEGIKTNSVFASGFIGSTAVRSNTANKAVRIIGGVFTSEAVIIGKVFIDANCDGIQNEPSGAFEESPDKLLIEEKGMPGIVIYMENGTRVVTDENGKFSIHGVLPGTHVLRLDETSLPEEFVTVPLSNRFMGNGASQFVDLRPGILFKADFGVKVKSKLLLEGKLQSEDSGSRDESGDEAFGSMPLEEMILDMSPRLDFIGIEDGATSISSRLDILVKSPLDGVTTLIVNGEKVGTDRIGRTVTNNEKKVVIYEFISVALEPGEENSIRAEFRDPFGNIREEKEITVRAAGRPAKIDIYISDSEIPADGSSTVPISVSVMDRSGNVLEYPKVITVSVTKGEILEKDMNPATEGYQIPYHDGKAVFTLRAPMETGASEIRAFFDDIEGVSEVFFAPYLRDMLVVGMGEIATGPMSKESRGAVFVKGDIGGGVLLTGAYDSEKDKGDEDEFFSSNDKDLDSESKYPIYGDESKLAYEAESQSKLYVKLEKDKSSLLYGDYSTDLTDSRLSAYTRTFNGIKADIEEGRFSLRSFVSHTDQTQVVDELMGRGVSGYYYLTRASVIEGSERVVIDIRDRRRPEHTISRTVMAKGTDYEIDYSLGSILFKSPVPSHDRDLNPVFIIVSYESKDFGKKHYNYGGRGAVRISDWIELGLTGIVEENEMDDHDLYGADVVLSLPWHTSVRAEYSYTESQFDIDSVFTTKEGRAWMVEADSRPYDDLGLSGYYRRTSDYFGNISAVDAMRGFEKYGADFTYSIDPSASIKGSYYNEKDSLNNMDSSMISLGAEKDFGNMKMGLDLSHEKADDEFVSSDSLSTRSPFDISEETPDDLTAVRASLQAKLSRKTSLSFSHKQDVTNNKYNLSEIGLDYNLSDLSRLYLKQEYGKFDDREESRTVIGGYSKVAKDTVAYNEYRLADGAEGYRNQQVIGLRNKFMLAENVTGNFTVENLKTLTGSERNEDADAFAATAAIEYLPQEETKLTSRLEYRTETSGSSLYDYLAEFGAVHKVSAEYSLLFRERYVFEYLGDDNEHVTSRTLMGLAYRPLQFDSFNALVKLEMKKDKNTADPDYDSNAYIFSAEGVYQLNRKTQFIGKYAGKLIEEDGFDSYTDMIAGRILYDITDRFDAGAEYRVINSHEIGSISQGGSVELGYRLIDDLWVSAGYSFDEFDSDLSEEYSEKGIYFRLRLKFDEKNIQKHSKRFMPEK